MIRSMDTAFEDREIALDCISVSVAPDILFDGTIDGLMAGEALADLGVDRALTGPEVGFLGDCVNQDRLQRLCCHFWHMTRANLTAAPYERHNGFMLR